VAFTLVVEDGSGKSTANTYLSRADATTYHTDHTGSSDWTDATDGEKDQALILATQAIDIHYGKTWKGIRSHKTQALAWPRDNVEDFDGFTLSNDSLPAKLESATAELALRVITETDGIIPDQTEEAAVKRTKVKIGSLEEEIEYMGGELPDTLFTIVEGLLQDLVENVGLVRKA